MDEPRRRAVSEEPILFNLSSANVSPAYDQLEEAVAMDTDMDAEGRTTTPPGGVTPMSQFGASSSGEACLLTLASAPPDTSLEVGGRATAGTREGTSSSELDGDDGTLPPATGITPPGQ